MEERMRKSSQTQVLKGEKILYKKWYHWASQVKPMVKNPPANAGDVRDMGSTPGLGRSPGGWCDNPLQCPCLESPTDWGAWQATVHKVAKSETQLKQLSMLYNAIKCFLKRWTGCLCEGRNFIKFIFHTQVLSTCYMPSTVLGAWNAKSHTTWSFNLTNSYLLLEITWHYRIISEGIQTRSGSLERFPKAWIELEEQSFFTLRVVCLFGAKEQWIWRVFQAGNISEKKAWVCEHVSR